MQTVSDPNTDPIYLWPGQPPDGPGPKAEEKFISGVTSLVSRPRLIVHRPEKSNGSAVLVISGGGYRELQLGKEGGAMANWLKGKGVTAFDLVYRLPIEGWKSRDVPFQDGQRAIRLIRSQAARFGLDSNKIGVLGFSAGGHLAGTTATEPDTFRYTPVDEHDKASARPNFVGLIYPVLTMAGPCNKTHTRYALIGDNPNRNQELRYSVDLHVDDKTPPVWLAHSMDDSMAIVDHSLQMFTALRRYSVPVEMHIFQTGGHGWGMGQPGTPTKEWSEMFFNWAKQNGFVC